MTIPPIGRGLFSLEFQTVFFITFTTFILSLKVFVLRSLLYHPGNQMREVTFRDQLLGSKSAEKWQPLCSTNVITLQWSKHLPGATKAVYRIAQLVRGPTYKEQ